MWESGWLYRRANTTTESGRETERKRRRQRFAPEAPGVAEVAREWLNDSALTQRVASGRHVACRVLEFELPEEMAGWDFGSWEQWTSQQPCHAMFIPLASDTSINKRL